jgi:hypothetical protein
MLDDVWTTRDLPILLELARRLDGGIDDRQAAVAAAALEDAGYIDGVHVEEMRGPLIATHVTEKARREVGLWPSAETGVDRLVAALDVLAEQAEDEEERTRWQRFREHVTRNGAQVGWSLVTAVLTGQLPGQ